MVILHYLALADGTAVSDQIITFGGLKDGLIRGTKFDHDMEGTQRFLNGKTPDGIRKIAEPWGRICRQQRRFMCSISLSAKLSGLAEGVATDEEFEASGKMEQAKADCYLTMEDAVTVGEILLSKLNADKHSPRFKCAER
ncbi:MAG: DUF3786 domain-containing protein [Gallintestinimicrobium sp.]